MCCFLTSCLLSMGKKILENPKYICHWINNRGDRKVGVGGHLQIRMYICRYTYPTHALPPLDMLFQKFGKFHFVSVRNDLKFQLEDIAKFQKNE